MKKPRLLSELTYGLQSGMSGGEYEVLKNKLIEHSRSIKGEDVSQLSKDIFDKYPEFRIMHDAYVRRKLNKIADAAGIVKIVAILYLIGSVIAAFAILASAA